MAHNHSIDHSWEITLDLPLELQYTVPLEPPELSYRIHHIDKNPHNNTESNLIVLCPKCHGKKHGRKS